MSGWESAELTKRMGAEGLSVCVFNGAMYCIEYVICCLGMLFYGIGHAIYYIGMPFYGIGCVI